MMSEILRSTFKSPEHRQEIEVLNWNVKMAVNQNYAVLWLEIKTS